MNKIISALLAICFLASCASTTIVKSWKEPTSTVKIAPSNKVLVIALVKDETSRRVVEDQLLKRMNTNAVASYTFLTGDMVKDANASEYFSKKLIEDKYTHVLIMRLADVEKETSYVPGTTTGYYGGYGRYYG